MQIDIRKILWRIAAVAWIAIGGFVSPSNILAGDVNDWRKAIEATEPSIVSVQFQMKTSPTQPNQQSSNQVGENTGLLAVTTQLPGDSNTAQFNPQGWITVPAVSRLNPATPISSELGVTYGVLAGETVIPKRERLYLEFNVESQRQGEEQCSGIVLSKNGVILAITREKPIGEIKLTTPDGKSHVGQLLAFDEVTGCAVIQSDASNLVPIRFSRDTIALGLPVACAWTRSNSRSMVVGQGIVAAKESLIGTNEVPSIETDITVRAGAIGGALINANGECIGIINAMSSRTGDVGQAYAILIPTLQPLIDRISPNASLTLQRGFIGVQFNDSSNKISSIVDKSPAAAAGILEGDILLQVADQPVQTSEEVKVALKRFRAGDKVDVLLSRGSATVPQQLVLKSVLQDVTVNSGAAPQTNTTLNVTPHLGVQSNPGAELSQPQMLGVEFLSTVLNSAQTPAIAPVLQVERTDLESSIQTLMEEISKLRKEIQTLRENK